MINSRFLHKTTRKSKFVNSHRTTIHNDKKIKSKATKRFTKKNENISKTIFCQNHLKYEQLCYLGIEATGRYEVMNQICSLM